MFYNAKSHKLNIYVVTLTFCSSTSSSVSSPSVCAFLLEEGAVLSYEALQQQIHLNISTFPKSQRKRLVLKKMTTQSAQDEKKSVHAVNPKRKMLLSISAV